ncbi:M15 family metallopeptidase [Chitinophaga horti]|uniref:D-alanyl-D-alanine dipeptidase n=1 Tax=Chitinophaga horti TaxID=2920382 RepID=A0ABY6IVX4_9BACT|nr:M15 family metallopeptidase [Chitinophaga horti]UYQ91527.1 M15 family metallopeptidase [Chitinophaga horti]
MKNIFILILILVALRGTAQDIPANKYGLKVVSDLALYQRMVAKDANMRMVNLETLIPGIKKDIRYATANNFTKQQLYRQALVFLRLPVAKALLEAQRELNRLGYGFKIFDGYRPYEVTEKMWAIVPDDRYAANPANGSGHNRGAAVDLTLIYLETGKEVVMPTDFDDFTEKAYHNYPLKDSAVAANRGLLKTIMEKHGFTALETEWWHYFFRDHKKYPLMDIRFEELDKR